MKLTRANYYSNEANAAYWSASFIKAMRRCEAAAMAQLRGEYESPESTALLVGGFVDAAFSNELCSFSRAHPELFNSRTGELKAEFRQAERMLERARRDSVFMSYLTGQRQKILTGEIEGLPFKCRLDFYKRGERIVDLKTVRDMRPVYAPERGLISFAEYWDWPLQMAIYREIEGNHLPCFLAVITKEDPPDIAVIELPSETLDAELALLCEQLPYFDEVRQGFIEPRRCERCAYCRGTKVLKGPSLLHDYEEI